MATVEEIETAKRLLDKALADDRRVERAEWGSQNRPLYLSTARWEFVRQARRLLEESDGHAP